RGGRKGPDAQAPLEAKRAPGRFIAESDVTWAANGSNVFEVPSETRDLPPLEVAPPPFPRLPHPGPPIWFPLSLKARSMLRRMIVPMAQPAAGGGAATANAPTPSAPPAGTTTNPTTASAGPLIPTDKPLSTFDKISMTIAQEKQREAEIAKAKQSDEERKASLDKLFMTAQTTYYGELATNPEKK